MNLTQSGLLSNDAFDCSYASVSAGVKHQSEPRIGQTGLFYLFLRNDVPILGRWANREVQDMLSIGHGASYSVTQPLFFNDLSKFGILNSRLGRNGRLDKLKQPGAFVTKRIAPIPSHAVDDTRQLAAITNEVRILTSTAIQNSKHITALLGAAWDEIPTEGRHWPRLLVEGATDGSLTSFLKSTYLEARNWGLKLKLLLDILEGLNSLHRAGVVHCDLKTENVVIFMTGSDDIYLGHQAKLCDFGFAVIQSDYGADKTITAQLGTEPWNAPELMGDFEARIEDLPKADIYSFGLLYARVFLQGGNPFDTMTAIQVRQLKRRVDDDPDRGPTLAEKVYDALLSTHTVLREDVRTESRELLLSALAHDPYARPSLSDLGERLTRLRINSLRQGSWIGKTDLPFYEEEARASANRLVGSEKTDETPQVPAAITTLLDLPNIVELEWPQLFHPEQLPDPLAEELIRDLQARASSDASLEAAKASYQLGVAHFEAIGVPEDPVESSRWLQKASRLGLRKALVASAQIPFHTSTSLNLIVEQFLEHPAKEVIDSEVWGLGNVTNSSENISFLRCAANVCPEKCQRFLQSTHLGVLRTKAMLAHLVEMRQQDEHWDFFLDILDELDGSDGVPSSDNSQTPSFTRFVARYEMVGDIGPMRTHLLQIAASIGDVNMAKALITEYGADIDDSGNTPGYTPLWISCLRGHASMVQFLLLRKANPTVRDTKHRRTILHFLNKFADRDIITRVLRAGLQAGLSVDESDADGNTPLLSTFVGWDFSNGEALRILLEESADPLATSMSGFTALEGAVRNLDVECLALLLEYVERREFGCCLTENGRIISSLQLAKAYAFRGLYSQSDFYCSRICGSSAAQMMSLMVNTVLDDGTVSILQSTGLSSDYPTALIIACNRGRINIAKAILRHETASSLDDADFNGMTALHWCAERGRVDTALELLRRGADPLVYNNDGLNVFHVAARFAPILLIRALDAIDKSQVPRPKGLDVKGLLAISTQGRDNSMKCTPYTLLIFEGREKYLRCAKTLRDQYELAHDAFEIPSQQMFTDEPVGRTLMTPTAYLTVMAVLTNLITVPQLEYMLRLKPKPRFVADTLGRNLFHYAVRGYFHASMSSNPSGYGVLRLLLQSFPGRTHVEAKDKDGNTAIHIAAAASNMTALKIINDHLTDRQETLNVNLRNRRGETPLDFLGRIKEDAASMDSLYMFNTLNERREATREFLKKLGAQKGSKIGRVIKPFLDVI